jgi:shikimate dehydrogenase
MTPLCAMRDFPNESDSETMTLSVRAATEADLDTLVRLNQAVQRLHADLEPNIFKPLTDHEEVFAYFAAQLEAPRHHFRLAEIDGEVAGYIWFEIQETAETPFTVPTERLYVHHIAVEESARRRGIASALLKSVEAGALALGIDQIALATWAANAQARAFFTAQGFQPSILIKQKTLK